MCMACKRNVESISECADGFEGYADVKDMEEDRVFSLKTDLETLLKYFDKKKKVMLL